MILKKAIGSHRIFSKEGVDGIINIQKAKDGKVEEYQVDQVRTFLIKKKIDKYGVIIYWSQVEKVFISEIPELQGCIAHGDTSEEALKEFNFVVKEWLAIAKEKGWQILGPKGRLLYA